MEQYGMVRKAEEHRGDNENATEGNGSYEKRRWFTWSRDVTCDSASVIIVTTRHQCHRRLCHHHCKLLSLRHAPLSLSS
jgi:hypothetical protein